MTGRVVADGKHLALDGSPFRVRGATYGSFVVRLDGEPYPEPTQIKHDLTAMADAGLNTVRTYTLPPPELIDVAGELGMQVLVGLHYRDWREEPVPGRGARRRIRDAGRRAVDAAMERCAGNATVLAVAVGNEVPADVVRVHGIGAVEATLAEMVRDVHDADEAMLATYCNFPSTEYLEVEGLDLVCFNVFLEQPDALRRYLRHLQVVAHEVPLVVSELGLASEIHGRQAQAEVLRWQLEAVEEAGCAGATVFSWTDEWGVAGESVEGWGFGIIDADRRPKPALDVVSTWAPLQSGRPARNLAVVHRRRLRLQRGTDNRGVPGVAAGLRLPGPRGHRLRRRLSRPHPGADPTPSLQGARPAPRGPERSPQRRPGRGHRQHRRLPRRRRRLPPRLALPPGDVSRGRQRDGHRRAESPRPGAGLVERAVAASPGGPVHVLVSDDRAEHVPGCNMAFRKAALEEIGGFDAVYTSAGDDVDVCWKLTDRGFDIGFSPAAQVRHHRRASVTGYLRQQRGYGQAERMLSGPHRHRFNRLGQARWRGFIYTRHASLRGMLRPVVYHGWLGSAPFQPVSRRPAQALLDWAGAMVPIAVPVAVLALVLGLVFPPAFGIAAVMAGMLALYATATGRGAGTDRDEPRPVALRILVGYLHVAQPLARLAGRLRSRPVPSAPDAHPAWTGERLIWLETFERQCAILGCTVRPGRPFDAWDLEISIGPLLACRFNAAIVWQWTRLHSCRLRPRHALVGALAVTAAVAAVGPSVALVVPALVVAGGVAEAAILRSAIRRALARSTPVELHTDDKALEVVG